MILLLMALLCCPLESVFSVWGFSMLLSRGFCIHSSWQDRVVRPSDLSLSNILIKVHLHKGLCNVFVTGMFSST